MKMCEKKSIQRDILENKDWRTHKLKLKYIFSDDLSRIKVSICTVQGMVDLNMQFKN